MVQIMVDDASGKLLQLPNWERVGNKISLSLNNNIILVRAHLTVKDKLEFARSHTSDPSKEFVKEINGRKYLL